MSQPFQKELVRCHNDDFIFERILAGELMLSVQGGPTHYCTPREQLPPEEYESMEIALFDLKGKWAKGKKRRRVLGFLKEYWDDHKGSTDPRVVGGHVPVELIQKAIDILRPEFSWEYSEV